MYMIGIFVHINICAYSVLHISAFFFGHNIAQCTWIIMIFA